MQKDELGRRRGKLASRHRVSHGYVISDGNARVNEGELVPASQDDDERVVGKVEAGLSRLSGYPLEAVDRSNSSPLSRSANVLRRVQQFYDAIGIVAVKGQPVRLSHVRAVA